MHSEDTEEQERTDQERDRLDALACSVELVCQTTNYFIQMLGVLPWFRSQTTTSRRLVKDQMDKLEGVLRTHFATMLFVKNRMQFAVCIRSPSFSILEPSPFTSLMSLRHTCIRVWRRPAPGTACLCSHRCTYLQEVAGDVALDMARGTCRCTLLLHWSQHDDCYSDLRQ